MHNTQTFLAVGHDAGNGLMRLENDRLTIEWINGPGQRVFQRIEAALKTAAEATGGSFMRNPASERILGGNLMTVHPLGGCTMGADRSSGVVNHKGQVFDAGVRGRARRRPCGPLRLRRRRVPCPLGIHPLLTITALAERAMILLARDYGVGRSARDAQPGGAGGAAAVGRRTRRRERNLAWFARWRRRESRAGSGEIEPCGDCRSPSPS